MNRLLNRLLENPFSLLVSLPRNDASLAEAALQGGAHGLKLHMNVHHHASGTRFGTFEEERHSIAHIVQLAQGVPVGVVPGGPRFASAVEFEALAGMGVDFFDAYPADTPAWTLTQRHLGRMLAAYDEAPAGLMRQLQELGMEMCEASILRQDEYGKDLTVLDIARYHDLVRQLHVPVVVPTQKNIKTAEVPQLLESGIKGLIIGAIVTGSEARVLERITRAFTRAVATG